MVIDRFSKYYHFLPLGHPYTVTPVVCRFFDKHCQATLHLELDCERPGSRLHWHFLVGALLIGGSQATDVVRLPPPIRWAIGGSQQNHRDVPSVPSRRLPMFLASMAGLGRILLHNISSSFPKNVTNQSGLRPQSSIHVHLHPRRGSFACSPLTANGAR
jgi:hypothetical protein